MGRVRTTPRKRPRQDRARATVDAILEATARILVTHGYDKATTNRIADAAGVSIGSLYQYFPNKQALVAALIDRHLDEMLEVIGAALARVTDVPLEAAARVVVDAMLEMHRLDPALHRVLVEQVPAVGRMARIRRLNQQLEEVTVAFLQSRASELRRDDLELAAFVLVHAVDAVTRAAVLEERDLGDGFADELVDLIVRYMVKT